MSNREVLEKAIRKAIDGGWKHANSLDNPDEWTLYDAFPAFNGEDSTKLKHPFIELEGWNDYFSVKELLFDHEFARALWGNELKKAQNFSYYWNEVGADTEWEFQLQRMVISPNPIDYLRENM